MHRNDKQKVLKRTVLALALTSAIFVTPMSAFAAGMGKITVVSALGQPLRAELEITASREELSSLAAQVAPVEAFRQANVEYAGVLSSVRFVLDKHTDGRPYFRIQTDRPVNEPFIDFLVELSWSSGRLVREYAFLLDPPEMKNDVPAAAVTAPTVQAPVVEQVPPAGPETAEQKAQPAPAPAKEMPSAAAAAGKAANAASTSAAESSGNTREVKRGDTLGKIAAASATDGVTLDQMLVALFNSNRSAFDGGNMNRLRAGKILTIPDVDAAKAVNAKEARKIIVAQSADFNAYRNRLAASTASQTPMEQKAQQSSSGKIAPKLEEKSATASSQDKLQVSRSEADVKAGKGKATEEDVVARDKALKEANSRIADLEKNLTDLKKLAELKSQAAADAQKAAQTEKAPPVPDKGVTVTAAAPALSPVAAAPEMPVASATAAVPAADEKPQPKPKKKFIPPPPAPEPSFVEDNPLLVYGGGAGLVAILGFLGFRFWKRKRDAGNQGITVSDLAASSVFGAAASESVDTGAASQFDFGHSTIDAVDTTQQSVDPIQEAEVYMAYGRDGQAEEILVDALQKDPGNIPVQLKLLEIYSGRKSIPQFNDVAQSLHTLTGGSGADWGKAAALGRALDAGNPLYGGAPSTPSAHDQTISTMAAPATESMQSTMVMESPPVQEAPALAKVAAAPVEEVPNVLDFDLDLGSTAEAPVGSVTEVAPASLDMDFDLDLGTGEPPAVVTAVGAGNSIDFDIAASVAPETPHTTVEQSSADTALDFDFDLGSDVSPASLEQPSPPLDLSAINLNLGEPAVSVAAGNAGEASEVTTKLELAQAYEEMGDREGARELLQEVIAEGTPAQQELARSKLSQLG